MTETVVSSPVELNLLLEWPNRRSGPQWVAIFSASVALHLLLFFLVIQLPSLIGRSAPEPNIIERHVPLYLPPDLMTQKAPNRQKPSKQIELADLLAQQASRPRPAAPRPSVRRFELPKQSLPHLVAKNTPQILSEAPKLNLNQTTGPLPPTGLTAPAPPPLPPAPARATVDDNQSEPMAGAPGSIGQASAQHAAVELKSDPQGADFKPYLTRILAIVRANWRRVIPESVRMGTLRGRTVIEFIINRDGSIPKLVTADSSGSEPLDQAAVAGLSMSNPLPPLPADYKGFQVRLAFSFAYNMPAQ
jgi:TonB family protein